MTQLERQHYLEQTGDAPTDKIVVIDGERVVEYRDSEWEGPFNADLSAIAQNEMVECVGKVSSEQYRRLCEITGIEQ